MIIRWLSCEDSIGSDSIRFKLKVLQSHRHLLSSGEGDVDVSQLPALVSGWAIIIL